MLTDQAATAQGGPASAAADAGVAAIPTSPVKLGSSRWVTILPVVFIMYTISFFDRSTIGVALPYISKDLGLTPMQAGLVGGVFVWGYVVTQLLSGWITLRVGARNIVGVSLILWGAAAILSGLVRNFTELAAMRIALGLFEGPVFAATSVLLAEWFMKPERGRAFGIWNLSSPLGAFLAGPISGLILAHYDWRLMMVIEGVPAWIWAALWWWRIPSSMDKARWLPAGERTYIRQEIAAEQARLTKPKRDPWWSILSEPALWLTFCGFALVNLLISGFTLWLPSALQATGKLTIVQIGMVSALPFVTAMAGIYLVSRHSDRHQQERRWHAALPCMITGALMIVAAQVPASGWLVQIGLFILLGFTMKMFLPMIFTHLTELMPQAKALPAIALSNGLGNLFGGFVGPVLIGYLRHVTSDFSLAFTVMGASGLIGGAILSFIKRRK